MLTIPESTVTRGTSKTVVTKCLLDGEDASILLLRVPRTSLEPTIQLIERIAHLSDESGASPIIKIHKHDVRNQAQAQALLALITEWCDTSLGDLLYRDEDDLLHRAYLIKQKLLDMNAGIFRRLSLLRDFVRGIELLHHHGIAHGDIYNANLWIRENLTGAVAGFGASLVCEPNNVVSKPSADVLDVIRYPAPELTRDDSKTYDPFPADVYGVGVLIEETLSMKMAWRGGKKNIPALNQNADVYPPELVTEDVFKMEILQQVLHITKRCLSLDVTERPKVEEVKDVIGSLLTTLEKNPIKTEL